MQFKIAVKCNTIQLSNVNRSNEITTNKMLLIFMFFKHRVDIFNYNFQVCIVCKRKQKYLTVNL